MVTMKKVDTFGLKIWWRGGEVVDCEDEGGDWRV